ncbi:MAG: hypothetical protein D6696_07990 [Acidobacteria bacterium]|nr:MAG: hypothetical protein D6696_07990 [Acidobacteriota bacterium]
MAAPLRLLVALPAEARPIVAHYRLERQADAGGFPFYRGDGDVALIVSGPGKLAAAAAVATLHLAAGAAPHAAWLDVGLAGHRHRPVGEAVVAGRVCDRGSGECWYPPQLWRPPPATGEVLTVEEVERRYDGPWFYDMEASGFCAAASRLASLELVQVLKIVSDNRRRPPAGLDKHRVAALVEARLGEIDALARATRALAAELGRLAAPPPMYDELVATLRFTASERRQLRRQLRRWQALAASTPLPPELLAGCRRGGELNRRLDAWLDHLAVAS